jgi:hypothetical protein
MNFAEVAEFDEGFFASGTNFLGPRLRNLSEKSGPSLSVACIHRLYSANSVGAVVEK